MSTKEQKKEIRKFNALNAVHNIPKKKIFFTETDYFEVQGLSTQNLSLLYSEYPEIANYVMEGLLLKGVEGEAVIKDLMRKAPTLGTLLIGLATRNEEGGDNYENSFVFMDFSPVVVMDAVIEILNLTRPHTEDQEKKFLAMMNKILEWLKKI